MKVDYIDHMGSDLTVVNAARVSFDKESTAVDWEYLDFGHSSGDFVAILNDNDVKLIKYLAEHNHWTPFGHCQATFRIKAPIFVARQLGKHQVGMVWNEVSRRYVDSEPEFYEPEVWRKKADNVKQGSSDEAVRPSLNTIPIVEWNDDDEGTTGSYLPIHSVATEVYKRLLDEGVCPEQARMVLPQSMYTQWYWTGSLAAWARVCKLRLDPHSQKETQEIAEMISGYMSDLFPVSWKELMS